MIYFLQAGDNGPIKIGYVADADQIKTWQEGSPVPLKLLTTFAGTVEVAVYLQTKFLRFRQQGKWFNVSQEIFDFIKNPVVPFDLLVHKPRVNPKKGLGELNQLLLKIKYQNRIEVEWEDIARELNISTEKLHKLRHEGFYEDLRWEQIQHLARLLNLRPWELVRLVEQGHLPDDTDVQ